MRSSFRTENFTIIDKKNNDPINNDAGKFHD